jgi:hypothetical protein
MNDAQREPLVKRLADHEEMERSVQAVVEQAVRRHKEMGNSIAVWRDGRVVIVPAEDIVLTQEAQPESEIHVSELAQTSLR